MAVYKQNYGIGDSAILLTADKQKVYMLTNVKEEEKY